MPDAVQRSLFDLDPPSPNIQVEGHGRRLSEVGIHFGTSTWSYPGWLGIVYSRKHASAISYLEEYVRYPAFTTVGADFTFYGPPNPAQLSAWKSVLPRGFKMVFKAWEEFTVDRFLAIDEKLSPGRRAGATNPRYLDRALFEDAFLAPFIEAGFEDHVACVLFEFRSTTAREAEAFIDQAGAFLCELPKSFHFAVEIREPRVLGARYREMLESVHASHVFNHWDRMPPLSEQQSHGLLGTGGLFVSRVLTPLKTPYAAAKKKFAPYNKLDPRNILPQMRSDVVNLCLDTIAGRLPGYILVNNRAEGCAPLTIQALEADLTSRLPGG